ncbi:ATP-binding protein [Streptomyces sp. ActVer]|nr:ATP-binding protein [Streptomyces sp. ActVer]MCZ4510593.1 ATP-binding protein [Streptomyces sp. ActVer]
MNTESDGVNLRDFRDVRDLRVRTWRRRLTPETRSVPEARRGARSVLTEWRIPADVAEAIELIVSELSTNAVRHARVPDRFFEVALTYDGQKAVEVEVSDASPRLPEPQVPPLDAESGRGLPLVAALAESWEIRNRVIGKAVWARVLTR